MHKSMEIKDDKVIVQDSNGHKIKRDVVNNIEEILITENNIEELEELIRSAETSISWSNKKIKSTGIIHSSLSILWGVLFILNLIVGNWFSSGCNFLCSAIWASNAYFFTFKPENKNIRIKKKEIDTLEKQLDEEKEKLKELENTKNNNYMYIDTSKRNISTSDKIIDLYHKLIIIYEYESNKRKYIKYFEKGILKENFPFLFTDDQYNFVEELIKNDLTPSTHENTNNKKKVLKKYEENLL